MPVTFAAGSAGVEQIMDRAAQAGMRRTRACRAVVTVLARDAGLSAAAVHRRLADEGVAVDLSTAHRVLARLERAGVVQAVSAGGSIGYRLVRRDVHSLVCRRCDREVSVPAAVIASLLAHARRSGFEVSDTALLTFGSCQDCEP
ncbi:Fur family transcriptional regulator [Actinoplanes sp. NPDC051859]|uniref:Fur family transcriptional regulator n=1 Tax=Actinoplanes sp. NPDC051859 TaxID=3363909 RepID=UPI0037AA0EEC